MTQAQALQELLDKFVSDDPFVHNGVLMLGIRSFVWTGASGFSDPDLKLPMRAEDQFQLASVTKIFTASALMTLVEEGRFELDAGIGRYLPPSLTRGLNVFQGREHGEDITPRQLMSHTSGLADFFGDGERCDGGVLPFIAQMQADPDRLWDPLDIVTWTKRNLHAHFRPGDGWHYSDTGLLLAALIIEQVTNKALHDFMRERFFAPLSMAHTYMLFREPARPSIDGRGVSRAYAGDVVYGETRRVTADWACGGLVSTAADLTRFLRAFVEDRIFRAPATKKTDAVLDLNRRTGRLLRAGHAPLRSFSVRSEGAGRSLGPHRVHQELHALLGPRRYNDLRHAEPGDRTRHIFPPPIRCGPRPSRASRIVGSST